MLRYMVPDFHVAILLYKQDIMLNLAQFCGIRTEYIFLLKLTDKLLSVISEKKVFHFFSGVLTGNVRPMLQPPL